MSDKEPAGEKPSADKKDSPVDMAAMLGMGGIFEGVSTLISKFGELAERGESLRQSVGETKTGKAYQSSMGFSVKFGPGNGNANSSDAMHVAPLNTGASSSSGTTQTRTNTSVPKTRQPQVDMFEEDDHVLLLAEMPGVASEAVQLTFTDRQLHIEGNSKTAAFKTQIELPRVYTPEQVTVTANNGLIEIRLSHAAL